MITIKSTTFFECCKKCYALIDANSNVFCPYCGTKLNDLSDWVIDVKPFLQKQRFEENLKELKRSKDFSKKMRKRIALSILFYFFIGIGILTIVLELIK